MREYIALGHMEEVNVDNITGPHYFLPHHCVVKPESSTTKLRVVFDASSKTSTNMSLNDVLHTGPTVQDELLTILLRFRTPRFVFTADIEKMYRQVLVQEDDRKYQLILWRENPAHKLRCYKLNTVTYGTTSAPYLATKCLQKLASEGAKTHPRGSEVLKRDFYVDDVMSGSNSLPIAIEMQEQLRSLLRTAGMNLRKWCANHPRLLKDLPSEDLELQLDFKDGAENSIKTLGLTWHPKTDSFAVKTCWPQRKAITKRSIYADTAHLFDPLGFMAPVTVLAKMFLQRLWELDIDWDDELPEQLRSEWTEYREQLNILNNIRIPRHVFSHKEPNSIQIHTFADASERAYGAAVYIRSITDKNIIVVRLLSAKTRLAPLKKTTIPRLELCAAKMAAEFTNRIKKDLKMHELPTYLWTDSTIVLSWINSSSTQYQTFVANRIAAIHEVTSAKQWRHVGSKENPADMLSRGLTAKQLEHNGNWFYGPIFLHGPESTWPKQPNITEEDFTENILEKKRQQHVSLPATTDSTHFLHSIDHKNSFTHLQRIIAYVLRFIKGIRKLEGRKAKQLQVEELEEALIVIIKEIQSRELKDELNQLQKTGKLDKKDPLNNLSPFLDVKGIIRVGGRLQASNLAYDAKHPMLLPYSQDSRNLTRLLMTEIHHNNHHVGPQTLLSITRQRFWPVKGKTTARSIVQNCVRCARSRPRPLTQSMGNLPAHRVQPARPFLNSGVDFFGPFWVHYKIRGKRPHKCYVAVFCCFSTKSVHLEVVTDLTTEAFIAALKRFTSRRGNCRNLYCDNATNFVGAKNQLADLRESIYTEKAQERIKRRCIEKGIDFHFIPPRAPHFGGLWEAAVKSAKYLLQRSVATVSLTYEELETVIVEIEAILNSRPLTPMSSDPNDIGALTPGHFLIGEPLTNTVDHQIQPTRGNLSQRWKEATKVRDEFWQRWTTEYLSELQRRYKWKEHCTRAEPGMMVLIKEENTPVLKWPLGRIEKVIRGADNLVRVADVKTSSGVLRRPIHKLAPLPVEQEGEAPFEGDTQPTGAKRHSAMTHEQHENHDTPTSSTEPPSQGPGSSTAKRRRTTSALGLTLLACLILPVMGQEHFEIEQFSSPPGIYFESVGPTHLVFNEWNLIVFYNMQTYWAELTTLQEGIKQQGRICNMMKANLACTTTVDKFLTIANELNNNNEWFMKYPARTKRAPLNIVGNIAGALFGVLDSEYAERMAKIINNLENNDQHLLDLIKNQTSLIDSTKNIMKEAYHTIDVQLDEFRKYVNKTMSVTNNVIGELQEQRLAEIFNSLSIQLTLIAMNYERVQSSLLNVVADTHHGRVNPLLLSPRQLQTELVKIKEHLPSTLRLPAKQKDLIELYHLMRIEGRVLDNQLIFRLKLPLFSYEQFELLKVIPIPIPTNGTFLIMKPSSEFLIVNLHHDQYYPLSKHELSSCTIMANTMHICKPHHPLYRQGSNISSCEISLITSSSPKCEFIKSDKVQRWIQLLTPNHWIYITQESSQVNIICGSSISQIILQGIGILNLKDDCTIKDETTIIHSHSAYSNTMKLSFRPTKNLTAILHPVHLAKIYENISSQNETEKRLYDLQKRIELLKREENDSQIQHHDVHQYTVSYVTFFIVLAMVIWFLWKCIGIS